MRWPADPAAPPLRWRAWNEAVLKPAPPDPAVLDRIQGRLDRLGLTARETAEQAGVGADLLERVLAGRAALPRGRALHRLAETLGCTISYLVGLEPDEPPPPELLVEDQASLGPLLSGDQEALLAHNTLDVAAKAALLLVARKMAGPEPAPAPDKPAKPPRGTGKRPPRTEQ